MFATAGLAAHLFGCATASAHGEAAPANEPAEQTQCVDDRDAATREWTAFRRHYPGFVQGVALSETLPGGCRVLIVAEPPEHVAKQDLEALSPELMSRSFTGQRTIGVDGWLKDLVVTLPPVDRGAVDELIAGIHYTMYGTTYGANPLPYAGVTNSADFFIGPDVDLQISPQELLAWLPEYREATDPVIGVTATVGHLLRQPDPGVYHVGDLVLWPLPADVPVDDQRVFARRFAIDSDLIVGGIFGDHSMLVVGRRRAIPIERLLPLRPETLLMLAGAETKELGQSFEGQRLMTGKLHDGSDWRPSMLSAPLHDTEFGGLLNLADVMIKSWSMNGLMEVKGYEWYPKPERWPFEEPILDRFTKAGYDTVVFNWNTKDRAVLLDAGSRFAMSFSSTGSLHPEYIPSGSDEKLDVATLTNKGFKYFRTIGDPTIVRVSQYTSFYQLARVANLRNTSPERLPDTAARQQVLTQYFERAAESLGTPDSSISARIVAWINSIPAEHRPEFVRASKDVRSYVTALVEGAALSLAVIGPEVKDITDQEFSHDLRLRGGRPELLFGTNLLRASKIAFLAAVDDQEAMLTAYRDAGAQSLSPWMHTHTLVRSRLNASRYLTFVGGHNVAAHPRVARIVRDSGGRSKPVILDGGATPELLKPRELRRESDGLKLAGVEPARKLAPAPALRPARDLLPAADEILVHKRGDDLVVAANGQEMVVRNRYEVADQIGQAWQHQARKQSKIKLEFHGLSEAESTAISHTLDLRLRAQKRVKDPLLSRLRIGKNTSTAEARRLLDNKVDVKSIELGAMSKPTALAKGGFMVETTVKAAPVGGIKGAWIKVKLFFKQSVPDTLQRMWTGAAERVRGRVASKQPTSRTIVEELRNELELLQREVPDMKFQIDFSAADITLTRDDTPTAAEESRNDASDQPA